MGASLLVSGPWQLAYFPLVPKMKKAKDQAKDEFFVILRGPASYHMCGASLIDRTFHLCVCKVLWYGATNTDIYYYYPPCEVISMIYRAILQLWFTIYRIDPY